MSILLWDPSSPVLFPLPAVELPIHCADLDGAFALRVLDAFMRVAGDFVTGLVFDAATPHNVIRRLLHGNPTDEDLAMLENPSLDLRWFNRIRYVDLPHHRLPRFPVKAAMVDGQVYHALGGVCSPIVLVVRF